MRKFVFVLLAVTAVVLVGPNVAEAQTYNQVNVGVQGGGTPGPGKTVTLTASGFRAGSTVTFTVFSDPIVLGTAVANAQGVATGTFTLPANLAPGSHRIEASGVDPQGRPRVVSTGTFTVPAPAASGQLSRTGSSSVPMALVGAALVGAGAGLVIVAKRRRAHAATAAA